MVRDLKSAATILLDTISTFNSPEIISYNDLVFYTVLTSMVSLGRKQLKEKVIYSPDILGIIREIPNLKDFMESFFHCKYKQFFVSFGKFCFNLRKLLIFIKKAKIIEQLNNGYLTTHKKYFVKEMRIVAYSQFLESYKTVTIKSMAEAFGVSVDFIDKYIIFSKYIYKTFTIMH